MIQRGLLWLVSFELQHSNLNGDEPLQRGSFRIPEQEDTGCSEVPHESESHLRKVVGPRTWVEGWRRPRRVRWTQEL